MYYFSFIGGLLSTLTPAVFPLLLVCFVVFEKLSNNKGGHMNNIFRLGIILIIFLPILAIYMVINGFSHGAQNSTIDQVILLEEILLLLFFIWFLSKIFYKETVINYDRLFIWLGAPILAFKLCLLSISSTGPIIGSLLSSQLSTEVPNLLIYSMLLFAVGTFLPFLAVLYFSYNIYPKINKKMWWQILQVIVSVYMIIGILRNIFSLV